MYVKWVVDDQHGVGVPKGLFPSCMTRTLVLEEVQVKAVGSSLTNTVTLAQFLKLSYLGETQNNKSIAIDIPHPLTLEIAIDL